MKRLRELRVSKKLKQKDLAEFLGLDRTTYAKYETGDSEPTFETIIKLANYYEVTTDYILGVTSDRNPQYNEEQVNKLTTDLERVLVKLGVIEEGEDLTDEQFNAISSFITTNAIMLKTLLKNNNK